MGILQLLILLFIGCGITSIVSYVCALVSYYKTWKGNDRKKSGIVFLIVGTCLAYFPLKYMTGGIIFRIGIPVLILLDALMIYKFLKLENANE